MPAFWVFEGTSIEKQTAFASKSTSVADHCVSAEMKLL
jgi:hypothetical protein